MSTGNTEGSGFAYDLTTEAIFRCDSFDRTINQRRRDVKIVLFWSRRMRAKFARLEGWRGW